jgi:hypothetical protein
VPSTRPMGQQVSGRGVGLPQPQLASTITEAGPSNRERLHLQPGTLGQLRTGIEDLGIRQSPRSSGRARTLVGAAQERAVVSRDGRRITDKAESRRSPVDHRNTMRTVPFTPGAA